MILRFRVKSPRRLVRPDRARARGNAGSGRRSELADRHPSPRGANGLLRALGGRRRRSPSGWAASSPTSSSRRLAQPDAVPVRRDRRPLVGRLPVASTLFRPIEQLLARTLAERNQVGAPTGDALRRRRSSRSESPRDTGVLLVAARPAPGEPLQQRPRPLLGDARLARSASPSPTSPAGTSPAAGSFSVYAALLLSEVLLRLAFAVVVAIGIFTVRHRSRSGSPSLRSAACSWSR